jgi:hypothetical protein
LARHEHVEDDDVWLQTLGLDNRRRGVFGFADYIKVGCRQCGP